jgi:hypothetical protein
MNGGCAEVCIEGTDGAQDYCSCRSEGYQLIPPANRKCFDVDECALNDTCSANQTCLNTVGSYYCLNISITELYLTLTGGDEQNNISSPLALPQVQTAAQILSNVDRQLAPNLEKNSRLQVIFVVMTVWMAIVTLTVGTLAVNLYKESCNDRRNERRSEWMDSVSSVDGGEFNDCDEDAVDDDGDVFYGNESNRQHDTD